MTPGRAAARAKQINQKRADEAPLLAAMGVLPTVTPEEVVERHATRKAAAEAHGEEQRAWEVQRIAAFKAELLALCGAEAVATWVAADKIGQPGYCPEYMGFSDAIQRVKAGGLLLMPHPKCAEDRARQHVDSQALLCVLRRAPLVFAWQAADALKAPILDVIATLRALRDDGLAAPGASGGWRAA